MIRNSIIMVTLDITWVKKRKEWEEGSEWRIVKEKQKKREKYKVILGKGEDWSIFQSSDLSPLD